MLTKSEFTYVLPKKNFIAAEVRETINLKNVECQSKLIVEGSRLFMLQRVDNRPVFKGYRNLVMTSTGVEDGNKWVQAFTAIGIFREMKGSMGNLLSSEVETSIRSEKQIRKASILVLVSLT